jgi:hypothetical protein
MRQKSELAQAITDYYDSLSTEEVADEIAWVNLRCTSLRRQRLIEKRSHECERGTQECVRHIASKTVAEGEQSEGIAVILAQEVAGVAADPRDAGGRAPVLTQGL